MARKVWKYKQETERVSYIRKPFAVRSVFSSLFALVALVLLILGFRQAVETAGQIPLNYLVMCLFSIIFSIVGFIYSIRSFFEREKDYLLSKISLTVTTLEIVFWILVCVVGL